MLTFDDGLVSFATEAVPLLVRVGFVATRFVVAGRMGGTTGWPGWPRDTPGSGCSTRVRWRDAAAGVENRRALRVHARLSTLAAGAAAGDARQPPADRRPAIASGQEFCVSVRRRAARDRATRPRAVRGGFGIRLAYASTAKSSRGVRADRRVLPSPAAVASGLSTGRRAHSRPGPSSARRAARPDTARITLAAASPARRRARARLRHGRRARHERVGGECQRRAAGAQPGRGAGRAAPCRWRTPGQPDRSCLRRRRRSRDARWAAGIPAVGRRQPKQERDRRVTLRQARQRDLALAGRPSRARVDGNDSGRGSRAGPRRSRHRRPRPSAAIVPASRGRPQSVQPTRDDMTGPARDSPQGGHEPDELELNHPSQANRIPRSRSATCGERTRPRTRRSSRSPAGRSPGPARRTTAARLASGAVPQGEGGAVECGLQRQGQVARHRASDKTTALAGSAGDPRDLLVEALHRRHTHDGPRLPGPERGQDARQHPGDVPSAPATAVDFGDEDADEQRASGRIAGTRRRKSLTGSLPRARCRAAPPLRRTARRPGRGARGPRARGAARDPPARPPNPAETATGRACPQRPAPAARAPGRCQPPAGRAGPLSARVPPRAAALPDQGEDDRGHHDGRQRGQPPTLPGGRDAVPGGSGHPERVEARHRQRVSDRVRPDQSERRRVPIPGAAEQVPPPNPREPCRRQRDIRTSASMRVRPARPIAARRRAGQARPGVDGDQREKDPRKIRNSARTSEKEGASRRCGEAQREQRRGPPPAAGDDTRRPSSHTPKTDSTPKPMFTPWPPRARPPPQHRHTRRQQVKELGTMPGGDVGADASGEPAQREGPGGALDSSGVSVSPARWRARDRSRRCRPCVRSSGRWRRRRTRRARR